MTTDAGGMRRQRRLAPGVVLFLHNRYRTTGGEERVVDDLLWLVREHLCEDAELLTRDSATLRLARAGRALLAGALKPEDVAKAVRLTKARVVHAHNLLPALGWRALAAAREAGARVVLHLHNYRLVCAVGTCFTRGQDCTRCHGRNTLPGVRLNCRGTGAEAVVYGAALAAHQHRLTQHADAIVVPSAFALERLKTLGAPLTAPTYVLAHVIREFADSPRFDPSGPALVASRLAPEKGIDVAIEACAQAGVELVIAGDGPERAALGRRGPATFLGRVDPARLAELRAAARVELVPTRAAETFGLAAAEAMAAGVPVLASATGALTELVPPDRLVPPGDAPGLAQALRREPTDVQPAITAVRERCSPPAVAARLKAVYR